jgi:hypothetical protein
VFESAQQRRTWQGDGQKGFYLGPALEHYRCFRVYITESRPTRIANAIECFPAHVKAPSATPADQLEAIIHDLAETIKSEGGEQYRTHDN